MRKNVLKKDIDKATELTKEFGYWSEEVRNFLSNFEYNARLKLHFAIKNIPQSEKVFN